MRPTASKYRKNYILSKEDVMELSKATHGVEDKKHAQVMVNEVWKRLGKKHGFRWKTVDRPINTDNPEVISAIPIELPNDEEE